MGGLWHIGEPFLLPVCGAPSPSQRLAKQSCFSDGLFQTCQKGLATEGARVSEPLSSLSSHLSLSRKRDTYFWMIIDGAILALSAAKPFPESLTLGDPSEDLLEGFRGLCYACDPGEVLDPLGWRMLEQVLCSILL